MLSSVILAGPPGTGKTTLAEVIADATQAEFVKLNAVMSGVKDLKEVCTEAERAFTSFKQRTVLFIDEIHRFNKSQQDALLPFVESGVVILVGATTENPYFEVNAALVSRSHVHLLRPLTVDDLRIILTRALADDRGYAGKVAVHEDAVSHMATIANGDARIALNSLELALVTAGSDLTAEQAEKILDRRGRRYDKGGEEHYNTVSAFIKTLRGSDTDAAMLWLYKMIESGEEPRFIFRRMMIFASEDIGLADPHALGVVRDAWQSFEMVGMPEGEYFLSHACIYLAQAPKSNAVKRAMVATKAAIKTQPTLEVPNHLRNAPVKGMAEQGYGEGYRYPHDFDEALVDENYFPIGMQPTDLYRPTSHGFEREVADRVRRAREVMRKNA